MSASQKAYCFLVLYLQPLNSTDKLLKQQKHPQIKVLVIKKKEKKEKLNSCSTKPVLLPMHPGKFSILLDNWDGNEQVLKL